MVSGLIWGLFCFFFRAVLKWFLVCSGILSAAYSVLGEDGVATVLGHLADFMQSRGVDWHVSHEFSAEIKPCKRQFILDSHPTVGHLFGDATKLHQGEAVVVVVITKL